MARDSYNRIKEIADRLGWPESFRDDLLVHDRRYLEGHDGEFLWSVRPSGTHAQRADDLCRIAAGKGGFGYGQQHGAAWRDIVRGYLASEARSFHCTSRGCHEITGRPEEIRPIMERWLKDCRAPEYRKREVLEGRRRR